MRQSHRRSIARLIAVIGLILLLGGTYHLFIRPGQLRWGASDEEVMQRMPGDELVEDPSLDATRAITIRATPQEIWPWLVQMGYNRAGYYGYDLIENVGSSRGLMSADSIVADLQDLRIGERVDISAVAYVVVAELEPHRHLLWASDDAPATGSFLWALEPLDVERTRLISRVRVRYELEFPLILLQGITEYADHVAIRRILEGIRMRVEGRADSLIAQIFDMAPWLLSFAVMMIAIVLVFRRESWLPAWLAALAAGAVLLYSLYSDAPVEIDYVALVVILLMLRIAFRADRAAPASLQAPPSGLRPAH